MKLVLIAIVLGASGGAMGQSSAAASSNSPMPPAQKAQLLAKVQQMQDELPEITVNAPRHSPQPLIDRDCDPAIIVRPPKGSFAVSPPQAPAARKLYPDLKLEPVEKANLEPLPRQWKLFEMEQIPVQWNEMKVIPIDVQPTSRAEVPKK